MEFREAKIEEGKWYGQVSRWVGGSCTSNLPDLYNSSTDYFAGGSYNTARSIFGFSKWSCGTKTTSRVRWCKVNSRSDWAELNIFVCMTAFYLINFSSHHMLGSLRCETRTAQYRRLAPLIIMISMVRFRTFLLSTIRWRVRWAMRFFGPYPDRAILSTVSDHWLRGPRAPQPGNRDWPMADKTLAKVFIIFSPCNSPITSIHFSTTICLG